MRAALAAAGTATAVAFRVLLIVCATLWIRDQRDSPLDHSSNGRISRAIQLFLLAIITTRNVTCTRVPDDL